jgi:hypothetical protein
MKNYSIVKVGNEYVVQAGDNSILKTTSRRKAVRFVCEAAALLHPQPSPKLASEADASTKSSISCDPREVP